MDTQKLRQRILDLAIRGKLVPQDPNDEPASVLLDRIRAEKERLIAEGKIKRPKSKKSTDKSRYQQFEIPDTWVWTTLGEIFSMQAGKGIHSQDLSSYSENCPYPCYGGNGVRGFLSRFSHKGTYPIIGRQGALCGNINVAQGTFYATEHAVVVECFANTNTFLWALFLEYLNLNQYATSTAQPGLSVAKIEEVPIPLPPIEEQERIVSNIHKWFGLIEHIGNTKASLSDTISLTKSKIIDLAMQGMLVSQNPADEPAADMLLRINPKAKIITDNPHYPQLPDNWVYLSLSDINSYKSSTVTPANIPEQLYDLYSVPIFSTMKPENIQGGEIGSSKQVIKKGDVLLCKINPHLNRVWEITEDSDNVQIASSEWIVVRSELHHPTFLKCYFNSPKFRTLLSSQVSGVGGSLTRAQPAIVKGYLVPVPPMEEQTRISKAIERWFECLDGIISGLSN